MAPPAVPVRDVGDLPINGTEDFEMTIPSDCNMREDLLFPKKFRVMERGTLSDLLHVNANRFSDGAKIEKPHFYLALISIVCTQLCHLFNKGEERGRIFKKEDLAEFCNMNDVVVVTKGAESSDKPINASNNEVSFVESKEDCTNVLKEKDTVLKFCVNTIGIAVITLFKHKHHFQTETQTFTTKLMNAFGMMGSATVWGIKTSLADIFRNSIHHISMRTKWNFAIKNVNSNALTVRLNGFGSGNAKAGILSALHTIATSNSAVCAYFSLFGKTVAEDLVRASEEKKKCSEFDAAVRTCENSQAFCGEAATIFTFQSVEADPAIYIAAIQKLGSTLGQAKTFSSLTVDNAAVAIYKENLDRLMTAFSEAQGLVKDVNAIIKMLRRDDSLSIDEFKENFKKISAKEVKLYNQDEMEVRKKALADKRRREGEE
eukprot:GHVU01051388.1.p1 GENE.GHVU01051388.1~~GHVU01051388.1.p1  ORF type:complete len:431 (-),score=72.64 GHVU01051388.1:214-1506(-)